MKIRATLMPMIRREGAYSKQKVRIASCVGDARTTEREREREREKEKMATKMGTKAKDVYVTQFSDRLAPGCQFPPFSALLLVTLTLSLYVSQQSK
jgi:hypothetical protein